LAGLVLLAWWMDTAGHAAIWRLLHMLVALLALYLSRRAIGKDIELVRSMDRLR